MYGVVIMRRRWCRSLDLVHMGSTWREAFHTVLELHRRIVQMVTMAAKPLLRALFRLPIFITIVVGITAAACRSEPAIPEALLDVVSGQVEVFSGPELALTVVTDELELSAGDRIRVLEGSQAAVVFFEGSVVLLDAGADITIEELSGDRETGVSNIGIFQGLGRSVHRVSKLVDAESNYGVRTSSSVGLVRGTGFVIEEDPIEGTKWKSFEGTVGVAGNSGEETLVEEGTSSEVPPGEDPSPPIVDPPTPEEQALIETTDEVIVQRQVEPPAAKDPEQSTPAPASTPTLPPVDRPPPQAAEAQLPPPSTPVPTATSTVAVVEGEAQVGATETPATAPATPIPALPTDTPAPPPTDMPTPEPTNTPTAAPAAAPAPTSTPQPPTPQPATPVAPTVTPAPQPTDTPTSAPTVTPSPVPTPTFTVIPSLPLCRLRLRLHPQRRHHRRRHRQ